MIFEDIYEPIRFQMKNQKGEVFDCETRFRTIEEDIQIEKLRGIFFDEKGKVIVNNDTFSERAIEIMIILCGKNKDFWSQFSGQAISMVIQKISELEKEKYKKKLEGK